MPISSSVAELDAEGGLYAGVEGGKASNKLMLLVLLWWFWREEDPKRSKGSVGRGWCSCILAGVVISRSKISIFFVYLGLDWTYIVSKGLVGVVEGPFGVGFLSAGLTNFIDRLLKDFLGSSPCFYDFFYSMVCRLRVEGGAFWLEVWGSVFFFSCSSRITL